MRAPCTPLVCCKKLPLGVCGRLNRLPLPRLRLPGHARCAGDGQRRGCSCQRQPWHIGPAASPSAKGAGQGPKREDGGAGQPHFGISTATLSCGVCTGPAGTADPPAPARGQGGGGDSSRCAPSQVLRRRLAAPSLEAFCLPPGPAAAALVFAGCYSSPPSRAASARRQLQLLRAAPSGALSCSHRFKHLPRPGTRGCRRLVGLCVVGWVEDEQE